MATRILTDKFCESVKAKSKDRIEFDAKCPGLALKITPKNERSWILNAKFPGSTNWTRRQLAPQADLSLADARTKARKWQTWIEQGRDPRHEEAKEATNGDSWKEVCEAYISSHLSGKRKSKDAAREIRTELIPPLGGIAVSKISRLDITTIIKRIKGRGSPYQARNVLGHAKGILGWALNQPEYGLDVNVASSIKPRLIIGELDPRQRTLSDIELLTMWRSAARTSFPMGPLVQLLALTALRKLELGQARWRELHPGMLALIREHEDDPSAIDWGRVPQPMRQITIPPARFKSKVSHVQPLSVQACQILAALPRFGRGDYIFSYDGRSPANGYSKAKSRLDRRMLRALRALARKQGRDPKDVELEGWVLHDLRRVVRSNLSASQVPDHIAEFALGHGKKGLQKIYDTHRYLPEIAAALQAWADKLDEIVTAPPAPKIVKLPKRA